MKYFLVGIVVVAGGPCLLHAGTIEFETYPDGSPTAYGELISDQYGSYGVTFALLDRTTHVPIGQPSICKTDSYCYIPCTLERPVRSPIDAGNSFIVADLWTSDLLITYINPVMQASGVLIDVDSIEQFTLIARNSSGGEITRTVIDTPDVPDPECDNPNQGVGNGGVEPWTIATTTDPIASILIHYTGQDPVTGVGIAFDNFSPSTLPADLAIEKSGPVGPLSVGDTISYSLLVVNDGPGVATNVLVQDYLPPGISFVSAMPVCTYEDGVISCALGTLDVGETAAIEITGQLDGFFIRNTATVSATENDLYRTDNTDAVVSALYNCESFVQFEGTPKKATLGSNFPNPFNPQTKIPFVVDRIGRVEIDIYDARGRLVRRLLDHTREAGQHSAIWSGRNDEGGIVASGVYFYEMRFDGHLVETRKAVILK